MWPVPQDQTTETRPLIEARHRDTLATSTLAISFSHSAAAVHIQMQSHGF